MAVIWREKFPLGLEQWQGCRCSLETSCVAWLDPSLFREILRGILMLLIEALCYHLVDLCRNCLLLGCSEKLVPLLCRILFICAFKKGRQPFSLLFFCTSLANLDVCFFKKNLWVMCQWLCNSTASFSSSNLPTICLPFFLKIVF